MGKGRAHGEACRGSRQPPTRGRTLGLVNRQLREPPPRPRSCLEGKTLAFRTGQLPGRSRRGCRAGGWAKEHRGLTLQAPLPRLTGTPASPPAVHVVYEASASRLSRKPGIEASKPARVALSPPVQVGSHDLTLVNLHLAALPLAAGENPSRNHGDGPRGASFAQALQETLKGGSRSFSGVGGAGSASISVLQAAPREGRVRGEGTGGGHARASWSRRPVHGDLLVSARPACGTPSIGLLAPPVCDGKGWGIDDTTLAVPPAGAACVSTARLVKERRLVTGDGSGKSRSVGSTWFLAGGRRQHGGRSSRKSCFSSRFLQRLQGLRHVAPAVLPSQCLGTRRIPEGLKLTKRQICVRFARRRSVLGGRAGTSQLDSGYRDAGLSGEGSQPASSFTFLSSDRYSLAFSAFFLLHWPLTM